MTKTKTFALNTNQLSPTGQYLLTYAQKHPEEFGVGSIVTTAGVANFVVPVVLGFTPAGPVAGAAVAWQALIGNLPAGALFATLETMTLKGVLKSVGGELIHVVGVAMGPEWASAIEWAKKVDWTRGEHWEGWARAAGIAGCEGWKKSVELAQSVDWAEVGRGAAWAGNEAVQGAAWAGNEAVQGAGWAANEAAQGVQWVFRGGWW